MKIMIYESVTGSVSNTYRVSLQKILASSGSGETVEFVYADRELSEKLSSWNESEDLELLVALYLQDTINNKLLISAKNEPKFKRYAELKSGHAIWGCCISSILAIEYAPEASSLYTQVHESLHLLGVDDCYSESNLEAKDNCNNEHCLMRYGINSLEICGSVRAQLQG